MQVRCPHCTTVFSSDRTGTQVCPHCGAQLYVPEEGGVVEAGPPPSGTELPPPAPGGTGGGGELPGTGGAAWTPPPDARGPTAWERRGELGWGRAFAETWKESVLAPQRFWPRVRREAPWTEALLYSWGVAALGALVSIPFQLLDARMSAARVAETREQLEQMPEQMRRLLEPLMTAVTDTTAGEVAARALGSALFWPLAFIVTTAVLHLGCLLFGAARQGFGATARAVGYGWGPMVIAGVSCVGFVGPLYALVLVAWGVKELQETSRERAAGAVGLPLLILCCCACCAAVGMAGSIASLAR